MLQTQITGPLCPGLYELLRREFGEFIARATDPRYTATQFALFTSLAAVPRTLINATTGWIVEQLGWFEFFLLCTALAVPGMLLLRWVAPWNESRNT
jgi:PAT family beta-lactamase induction signal transducer AmpG